MIDAINNLVSCNLLLYFIKNNKISKVLRYGGGNMPIGIVESVNKNYTLVKIDRQEMCGDCHACDMVHPSKKCMLKCQDQIGSQVGDKVVISLEEQIFLKATYTMYGLPFMGFMAGLGLGYLWNRQNELLIASTSLLGALLMLLFIYAKDKKNKFKKYLPYIVSKL